MCTSRLTAILQIGSTFYRFFIKAVVELSMSSLTACVQANLFYDSKTTNYFKYELLQIKIKILHIEDIGVKL